MGKRIDIKALSAESINEAARELEHYAKKLNALPLKANNALLDSAREEFNDILASPYVTHGRALAITSSVDYGTVQEGKCSGKLTAYGRNETSAYGDFNILLAVEFVKQGFIQCIFDICAQSRVIKRPKVRMIFRAFSQASVHK